MAEMQTLLQVFVASPDDVLEERQILEDVISEWNLTWSGTQKVRLELLKWETHTYPAIGKDTQDVVNQQIGENYDTFLGIMWGRFGSPTNQAGSGTEEEFNRAYSRLKTAPGSVQIMFYFKDAGIPPSKMDPEQLPKVLAFKSKIAAEYGGLYHEFEAGEDFRTKTRIHLSKVVQDWLKANAAGANTPTRPAPLPTIDVVDPLANLTAVTGDDDDDGLVELLERARDAMATVYNIVQRMSEATHELGEKFHQRRNEVNELTANGTKLEMRVAKRISNNTASDIEIYVNRIAIEIPAFHEQHQLAMDTFGKTVMIADIDLNENPEDIGATLTQMQSYRDSFSTLSDSLSEFRGSMLRLPRMTTAFNRARRRAVAVMDDLLDQLRIAANQSTDVVQLLERMASAEGKNTQ